MSLAIAPTIRKHNNTRWQRQKPEPHANKMTIPTMHIALSKAQKAELSRLARKAFNRAKELGLTDLDESTWRAEESIAACGKRISQATNGDYCRIESHFANLAGDSGRALDAAMRGETDEKRQALVKLQRELHDAGLAMEYAEQICRDTYHCNVDAATPQQIWQLMFTIRMRRAHDLFWHALRQANLSDHDANTMALSHFAVPLKELSAAQLRALTKHIKSTRQQ